MSWKRLNSGWEGKWSGYCSRDFPLTRPLETLSVQEDEGAKRKFVLPDPEDTSRVRGKTVRQARPRPFKPKVHTGTNRSAFPASILARTVSGRSSAIRRS